MRKTFSDVLNVLPPEILHSIRNPAYFEGLLDGYYGQDWRTYHNYDHLVTLIELGIPLWQEYSKARQRDFVAAIIFHDVIYNLGAGAGINEAHSAVFAQRFGPYCFNVGMVDWAHVFNLISATSHQGGLIRDDEKLLADLDMAGFAAAPEVSDAIGRAVKIEYLYAYRLVDVERGRLDFLQKLLAKPVIYYTSHFSENAARKNIMRQIEELKKFE